MCFATTLPSHLRRHFQSVIKLAEQYLQHLMSLLTITDILQEVVSIHQKPQFHQELEAQNTIAACFVSPINLETFMGNKS